MSMKVRLTRFEHGRNPVSGALWQGTRGQVVELDDETANALVSSGAAEQVNPFSTGVPVTGAPPYTPEKLPYERARVEQHAEALGQAEQAAAAGREAFEAGDDARAKQFAADQRAARKAGAPEEQETGVLGSQTAMPAVPTGASDIPTPPEAQPRQVEPSPSGQPTGARSDKDATDTPRAAKDEEPKTRSSGGGSSGRKG